MFHIRSVLDGDMSGKWRSLRGVCTRGRVASVRVRCTALLMVDSVETGTFIEPAGTCPAPVVAPRSHMAPSPPPAPASYESARALPFGSGQQEPGGSTMGSRKVSDTNLGEQCSRFNADGSVRIAPSGRLCAEEVMQVWYHVCLDEKTWICKSSAMRRITCLAWVTTRHATTFIPAAAGLWKSYTGPLQVGVMKLPAWATTAIGIASSALTSQLNLVDAMVMDMLFTDLCQCRLMPKAAKANPFCPAFGTSTTRPASNWSKEHLLDVLSEMRGGSCDESLIDTTAEPIPDLDFDYQ